MTTTVSILIALCLFSLFEYTKAFPCSPIIKTRKMTMPRDDVCSSYSTALHSFIARYELYDSGEGSRCFLRIRDSGNINYEFFKGKRDFGKFYYNGLCSLTLRRSWMARLLSRSPSALGVEMVNNQMNSVDKFLLRVLPPQDMMNSVRFYYFRHCKVHTIMWLFRWDRENLNAFLSFLFILMVWR